MKTMKEYYYSYEGKPLKKNLKNKPLQNIRQSNIDFLFIELKDEYIFKIVMNTILQPAARPRDIGGSKRKYDPLASYKDHIIKQIEKMIDKYDLDKKYNLPIVGEIHSKINIYKKPPKSWSMIKRFNALQHKIVYDSFPDLDNVEKTAWDTLADANIIWNDKAVTSSYSTKNYGEEDRTEIIISIRPFAILPNTRLNKDEINYIKEIYEGDEDE